jgi:hypothetical protein
MKTGPVDVTTTAAVYTPAIAEAGGGHVPLLICPCQHDNIIEGHQSLQRYVSAQGLAEADEEQLNLVLL